MLLSRLHDLRREKRLSKVKLAELSGVSRYKITRMEDKNKGEWVEVVRVLDTLGYEIKLQIK